MDRDVFLCHAREDKARVVRELACALERDGITYWLDEAEIKWGDSVTQKVNEGLARSRFVIVVLSESFLAKRKTWPRRELNAALNIEATSGDVKVLPLLVGDSVVDEIQKQLPLLNDKLYETWEGDPGKVVSALKLRLPQADAGPSGEGHRTIDVESLAAIVADLLEISADPSEEDIRLACDDDTHLARKVRQYIDDYCDIKSLAEGLFGQSDEALDKS